MNYLGRWPVRVYLFGSRARGDAVPGSDIDIALLPEADMPVDWLAGLREQLEASHVLCAVDVLNVRDVSDDMRRKISREGILWSD